MNTNLNEAKALAPSDGLGVNRLGNAILCYAWGESDRPEARIAKSAEEVRQFLITEAFGDDKDETLGEWMQELAVWDWREDGQLRWEFEIGGVWLEDIVDENTRAPQPKAKGETPIAWTIETMQLVNKLTPDIKEKAFDPDWFLLRQRFEEIEALTSRQSHIINDRARENNALQREIARHELNEQRRIGEFANLLAELGGKHSALTDANQRIAEMEKESAPYWLCYALAEQLENKECERSGINCVQSSDCITEWCPQCAATHWLAEQRELSKPAAIAQTKTP